MRQAATPPHRPVSAGAMAQTEIAAPQLAATLLDLMDALLATLEQETELVRRGRLAEAAALDAEKSQLSGRYLAAMVALKAQVGAFRSHPEVLEALHRRHDLFRALLQINLAVLATAHAVAEGLVRGAAAEVARKSAPQSYAANGAAPRASPARAQPLALCKST